MQINGPEKRYATALFQLAQEDECAADVSHSVHTLSTALADVPTFQDVLKNPVIETADKVAALKDALGNRAPLFVKFLEFGANEDRLDLLAGMLHAYNMMEADAQGEVTVAVTAAQKLSADQVQALEAFAMKTADAKSVVVTETVDESVLGGMRVQIGSRAWDATLKGQLNQLKQHLTQ